MQESQKIEFRKERDFGQKFNATIEFIRQEFKPLFKGVIYIAGPFIALASLVGAYYQKYSLSLLNFSLDSEEFLADDFWISAVALFLFSMLAYVLIFAVVNEYVKQYQATSGKSVEVKDLWEKVRSALPGYILSALGYAGLVFLISMASGFIAAGIISLNVFLLNMIMVLGFIFGIFFLTVGLYLTIIAYNTERTGLFGSINLTIGLLKGNWWRTLGLFIVSWFIVSIVSMVFTIPNIILTSIGVWHSVQEKETLQLDFGEEILYALTSFVSSAGGFFMSIIIMLIMIFQYYNLVEKRDASGLMERIQSMGSGSKEDEDEEY